MRNSFPDDVLLDNACNSYWKGCVISDGFLRKLALSRPGPAGHVSILEKKIKMGRAGLERGYGAHYNYSFAHAGAHRKPVDQTLRSRWFLSRVWAFVVIFATLFLLASVSPYGNSITAKVFYPRKLTFDSESSSQLLWERRTEKMFVNSFSVFRWSSSKNHPRTLTSHVGTLTRSLPSDDSSEKIVFAHVPSHRPYIEDIVALPEDLDLFIVRHGSPVQERISACRYRGELKSSVRMVEFLPDKRLAVTCTRPSELRFQKRLQAENVSLELDGGVGSPLKPSADGLLTSARWDEALVYAAQSTDEDVVLYVKNLFDSNKKRKASEYTELENFRCRFGDSVETPVTAGAQEVFRCQKPSLKYPRVKVHLLYKGKSILSVAYYHPVQEESSIGPAREAASLNVNFSNLEGLVMTPKKYRVCSCTMIWNVAKFLKEWVLYNSDLGVEKFFLYDNNSEDGIRRVLNNLLDFNVTRRSWPWVKTQEAGFSHCAIEAQRECSWILFTDVDEYLFPRRWLQLKKVETTVVAPGRASASPLVSLIEDTLTRVTLPAAGSATDPSIIPPALQVGQISFQCRNFGPSGKTTHPSEGVTQGYTCRDQHDQRHKSMVYFPALKSTLQNVIHHFYLKPNYQTVYLDVRQAVVNHYKFQAWSEFQTKYTKRASTYVVDWKEPTNLNSRDRPEGLGPEPTKPLDWEQSHCEVNDHALRDYTRRRFGVPGGGESVTMAWEL